MAPDPRGSFCLGTGTCLGITGGGLYKCFDAIIDIYIYLFRVGLHYISAHTILDETELGAVNRILEKITVLQMDGITKPMGCSLDGL